MKYFNSFKHAWDGVWYAFRTQSNMQIHFAVAVVVMLMGWYVGLSWVEWMLVMFAIILVWVVEMINTAIESMTNLITMKYSQHAKIAKDVSAGMVLITSLGAVLLGLVIYIPYFL